MELRRHCLLWGLRGCRSLRTNLCWRFQPSNTGQCPSTICTAEEIPKMEILFRSSGPSTHLSTFLLDDLLRFYTPLDYCTKYDSFNFQFHLASSTWRRLRSSWWGWCLFGWYGSTWAATTCTITCSPSASPTFFCISVSTVNTSHSMFVFSTSFSPLRIRTLSSATYSVMDEHKSDR